MISNWSGRAVVIFWPVLFLDLIPLQMITRRRASAAMALSLIGVCAALILIAGTQSHVRSLLDQPLDQIVSAMSETDRASAVLSKEGGLSLVGRDYEVNQMQGHARSRSNLITRTTLLFRCPVILTPAQGNAPKSRAPPAAPAAAPLSNSNAATAHPRSGYVFGSSGGLLFGKGRGSTMQSYKPTFAQHATISDFHFGDDGGLLFGKRPSQASLDTSMKKVPKSVKDAIKEAKKWAKQTMGGIKDADSEVAESTKILANLGVSFGAPSMVH